MAIFKCTVAKNLALFAFSAFLFACPQTIWAKNPDHKAKKSLHKLSMRLQNEFDKELMGNVLERLKKELDKEAELAGNDNSVLQQYIDNYPWKGVVENKVTAGIITVSDVKLNGHSKAIVVKPGERIEGELKCSLNQEKASSTDLYRVILGIKGLGPQTMVYNCIGAPAKETHEKFILKAPSEKGVYELRFRPVAEYSEFDALQKWNDQRGEEPDGKTTVFLIIVKS